MIFLLVTIGLLSLLYLSFKRRFAYWKDRGVGYVLPQWSNLIKPIHPKDFFGIPYKEKDGGPFMGSFILIIPTVTATSLDFVQNVLVRDFSHFHERGMYINEIDDPLSGHLFSLDGEKWKSLRAKLSPTFTSGKMKFMFSTVIEVAERFRCVMDELIQTGDHDFEMKDLLARFTTDVIGTCAFGIECNSLKDPNAKFRVYGNKVFTEPNGPIKQLISFLWPKLAKMLHLKLISAEITEFFMNTVRETIEYREKNSIRRNDFMDLLIQLKNNDSLDDEHTKKLGRLSVQDIAAQCFLFFLAGFETSSTTMMYCLYELALNPDIQVRARQEIEEVLANHDGKLTYEAVKEMCYIDQIISEALRKYPPGFTIMRQCAKDYRVPDTNCTIEKGTRVFIPVYAIHHDPEIYSNPELFDPERFLPEQVDGRHPMSFLGFGDGPRNCIGLRFGRLQSQIGLITLLKNFKFGVSAKTPMTLEFDVKNPVLSPKGGIYLDVTRIIV